LAGLAVPVLLLLSLTLSVALRPATVLTNGALIPAHQSIYAARQLGRMLASQSAQAAEWLPQAIRQDPDNPELHAAYGSLMAWLDEPEVALEALARRVALDGRRPYAYAPFLARQRELAGEPPEDEWQALLRVYRQWQLRFPDRAEHHALMALVQERHLHDRDAAAAVQAQALEAGALPRSLLEHYSAALVAGRHRGPAVRPHLTYSSNKSAARPIMSVQALPANRCPCPS
jgi:hypothetical protein